MGETPGNIKIYDTSGVDILYSDSAFSSTTTIASILQQIKISAVSNTIGGTAIDSSLSTLNAYNTYGDGQDNLNLYSLTPVEIVDCFMRNGTKYKFAAENGGVTSVNGQTGDVTVQGTLNYYSEGSNTANVTVGSGNDVSSINAATTNDGVQISATKHGYATSGVKVAGPNVVVTSSDSINTTTMTLVDDNVTIATPAKTYTFDSNSTTGVARLSEVIQNDTTGTTTSVAKIWAGTQAEYNALQTYNANTIYHIY